MGSITGSRVTSKSNIVFSVNMPKEEALHLKGHIDDIYVFSDRAIDIKTNLSERGKNSATKYFLIPRQLRKNLKFNNDVACQKIETKSKVIFVYTMDKY